MEFKQLESFLSVVKHGSFTKAAQERFISQPTISTHIRALEEELGVKLIVRTTKNIEVTQRGWEFYECASNILGLRDNLLQSWAGASRQVIHLGTSTIPSAYILPEILPAFGKKYPDIYFVVNQSDSQGIIEAMHHGQYDAGLIGMPYDDEILTCVPFYKDRIVLITPVNEHFLALKEKNENVVTELLQEPLILREEGSGSQKSVNAFFEYSGIREENLKVIARINDQESIKNLVASGLGISLISKKAAQNFVDEKRVLMFELSEKISGRSLYVVYRKNSIVKSYVDVFIQYVKKHYEEDDTEVT